MIPWKKLGKLAAGVLIGLMTVAGCGGVEELGVTVEDFVVELTRSALSALLL